MYTWKKAIHNLFHDYIKQTFATMFMPIQSMSLGIKS